MACLRSEHPTSESAAPVAASSSPKERPIGPSSRFPASESSPKVAHAARAQRAVEEDDALFRHYAETCVDEWARQGKSTRPMEVELAKPRDRVTRVGYAVD